MIYVILICMTIEIVVVWKKICQRLSETPAWSVPTVYLLCELLPILFLLMELPDTMHSEPSISQKLKVLRRLTIYGTSCLIIDPSRARASGVWCNLSPTHVRSKLRGRGLSSHKTAGWGSCSLFASRWFLFI